MKCPQCNQENVDTAKFCKECGRQIGLDTNKQISSDSSRQRSDPGLSNKHIVGIAAVFGVIALTSFLWYIHPSVLSSALSPDFKCGHSYVRDASGIMYGTVLAKDGMCWLDRNLGASRVATSPTDETAFGWYFQWGRGADGHQLPNSTTTTTLAENVPGHGKFIVGDARNNDWRIDPDARSWSDKPDEPYAPWSGAKNDFNDPCPEGFRPPHEVEWKLLAQTESITDSESAFDSSLKLVSAGYRDASLPNKISDAGFDGLYWSNTPDIFQAGAGVYQKSRAIDGHSIRCIFNETLSEMSVRKRVIRKKLAQTDHEQQIMTGESIAEDTKYLLERYPLVKKDLLIMDSRIDRIDSRVFSVSACNSEKYPNDIKRIAICVNINDPDISWSSSNTTLNSQQISEAFRNKYEPLIDKQIESFGYNPDDYEIRYIGDYYNFDQ